MEQFKFRVLKQDHKTQARIGEIQTSHGKVDTPAFVPVGTQATVKTLTPEELNTLGVQLFFVNTYHTYLRPGVAVIKKFGGLHRFMGWNGPIITDSGGFQIFSLARNFNRQPPPDGPEVGPADAYRGSFFDSPRQGPDLPSVHQRPFAKAVTGLEKTRRAASSSSFVKITEEGVEFRSHWDGSLHQFTPEKSIEIQHALGADIILAFDDCTPYPVTYEKARISMERTHRWAERSFVTNAKYQMLNAKFKKPYQALYGVIQGSIYEDLRKESAKFISSLPFAGIAIGGVSVGESKEEMAKVLKWVTPILPSDRPRHLLGVGEIDDIFTLVEAGIDTFDCVAPTRLGRMGHLYTNEKLKVKSEKFTIDITKKQFAADKKPIDPECACYTCQHFSRAYLHHLFRVRELLAYRLATIHNIYFVQALMRQIRQAIIRGKFLELKKRWLYNE